MKKALLINFFDKFKSVFLLGFLAFLSNQNMLAQVQNNGTLFINQSASLYNNGVFTFGTGSITKTERGTGSNEGKLIFGASATSSGAGATSKFVDGFASTLKTGAFELPTGDGTTYAPVTVNNTSLTNGVAAAYNHATPTTLGTGLGATVTALLGTGYWNIKGDNAIITLKWSSDISALSADISNLVVVGYNGTTSKWEEITSSVATGTTSSGSVATAAAVTLSSYTAYTIGSKGTSCPPVFTSTGSKTWTGSAWSPAGSPTLGDAVTLAGNYPGATAEGSFVCNSLAMGDYTITLTGQQSVEVVNDVTSGTIGKIIMSSETSFVQRKPTGTAPKIELTKTTRAIKRYDYVYWGSPVAGDVSSQLSAATATGESTPGAFDLKYSYVSGFNGASGGWQNLGETANGKGFIMRVKDQAPFTDANSTGTINLKFTGAANNGTIPVTLGYASGLTARNNNLLANPYPSAIDADKFLTQNSGVIDGAIYLWRANTSSDGSSAYAVSDYIAYTKAGASALSGTSSASSVGFNGKIASGQGFKVRATGSGDVQFNNCMRVAGDGQNSNFMRTTNAYAAASDATKDRFNLSLQTTNGIASQLLVAYLTETTLGYDHMYDAELLSTSATRMYSILDNSTQKLAINARPSFVNTDQVTVGYTKADATPVQMSINVVNKQGVFANNQTPIYLQDTQLNIYHNFANGAYTFATTAQEDNNRFKIVYQAGQLNNDAFDISTAFATLNNDTLEVKASSDLQNVEVFDLTGRLILSLKPLNIPTTVSSDFHHATGVYIVKMLLTNGQTFSQKLIQK